MAAKKMARKMDKGASCECGCHDAHVRVTGWIMVILGLLGLLQAVGYINLASYWFGYVWALIVLVLGIKKVFWFNSCDCCK